MIIHELYYLTKQSLYDSLSEYRKSPICSTQTSMMDWSILSNWITSIQHFLLIR